MVVGVTLANALGQIPDVNIVSTDIAEAPRSAAEWAGTLRFVELSESQLGRHPTYPTTPNATTRFNAAQTQQVAP